MTIKEACAACNGTLIHFEIDVPVKGAQVDSRKITKGNLFIAVPGEKTDGHKFVNKAFELGAAACITEHEIEDAEGPCILVENSIRALGDIAQAYRKTFNIPVVGITGSVGKTSTKEMIASVLSEKYNVQKTAGNFNNDIGMPLTLMSVEPEHEVAVVEMGINHFGEMDRLFDICRPDIFVMTNIGACHLEFLGDLDGVLKAKTEGIKYMSPESLLVINGDDEKLATLRKTEGIRVSSYGIDSDDCDVYGTDIKSDSIKGISFVFNSDGNKAQAYVNVPGRHMVYNALAAVCVAKELRLDTDQIKDGIFAMRTITGRNDFVDINGFTVINDCYNANPASMKASLEVLSRCKGRKVAVLGDMGELGAEERLLHYQVGEYAASLPIDAVFLSGELSIEILNAIRMKAPKLYVYHELETGGMIERLLDYVETGDTILVKASHFMHYESVTESLKECNITDKE